MLHELITGKTRVNNIELPFIGVQTGAGHPSEQRTAQANTAWSNCADREADEDCGVHQSEWEDYKPRRAKDVQYSL